MPSRALNFLLGIVASHTCAVLRPSAGLCRYLSSSFPFPDMLRNFLCVTGYLAKLSGWHNPETVEIQTITSSTALPVNVLSMATLPPFEALRKAGVRRLSLESSLFRSLYNKLDNTMASILNDDSEAAVFRLK